ncbi:hypothetical protein NDU88_006620 [Pleurodeles waltl]|uniref:Uncharacterized protein n=1 Tax=Pleurodeles waltl TaxID=8319 RepID=A0AAV7PIV8_PLEWA|nr:hypothetical protein NDU88_006620 [Pleurodeles waltl]
MPRALQRHNLTTTSRPGAPLLQAPSHPVKPAQPSPPASSRASCHLSESPTALQFTGQPEAQPRTPKSAGPHRQRSTAVPTSRVRLPCHTPPKKARRHGTNLHYRGHTYGATPFQYTQDAVPEQGGRAPITSGTPGSRKDKAAVQSSLGARPAGHFAWPRPKRATIMTQ